ncbi:MAG: hypothetical protein HYW05_03800 [Candidatus Diapherotrites archaeon]|nr:hypothetical protein [Candidatus Diapherotrites archaeon]
MTHLTTIQLDKSTKNQLDKLKEYKRETYDEVVKNLVEVAEILKKEPELKEEVLEEIAEARKHIRMGKGLTTKQLIAELGIKI